MLREEPATPISEQDAEPRRRRRSSRGTGIRWSFVLGIVLVVALIAFIAQNDQQVEFEWLWVGFRASLAVMLLATAVVAVAATALVGLLWRTRRRHRAGHLDDGGQRGVNTLHA